MNEYSNQIRESLRVVVPYLQLEKKQSGKIVIKMFTYMKIE